ncbi:MAG: low molecular weight protein tyrosine phosphatase family protein [Akkermansiaceae bacterium]
MESSPPNVLFVCAKNQWRSPTAAAVYRNDARINVQSAGLSQASPQTLSEKLLIWADLVLVMEDAHAARIRKFFRKHCELPEVISLGIPDDYPLMHPDLIALVKERTEEVLETWL